MPNLHKEIEKCKHPNSRRTLALARRAKKINNREKTKLGYAMKANIVGKKLSWFSENVEDSSTAITPEEYEELIENYLKRFDEEIEQINIKKNLNNKRGNQHASREAVIKMTLEKEMQAFNTCGIELPNLCDPIEFESFKNWDGSAFSVQHLKMNFISRKFLKILSEKRGTTENMNCDQ